MELITEANLTCPECGYVELLDIPLNYLQIIHQCSRCGARLKPKPGDCCVFCSYADSHCISKQLEALQKEAEDEQ